MGFWSSYGRHQTLSDYIPLCFFFFFQKTNDFTISTKRTLTKLNFQEEEQKKKCSFGSRIAIAEFRIFQKFIGKLSHGNVLLRLVLVPSDARVNIIAYSIRRKSASTYACNHWSVCLMWNVYTVNENLVNSLLRCWNFNAQLNIVYEALGLSIKVYCPIEREIFTRASAFLNVILDKNNSAYLYFVRVFGCYMWFWVEKIFGVSSCS